MRIYNLNGGHTVIEIGACKFITCESMISHA